MGEKPFIITRYDGHVLKPESPVDTAFLDLHYNNGKPLKTVLYQQRSIKHHNLYWAVLRRIVEITGGEIWANVNALDYAVKVHLRLFGEGIRLFNGEVRFEVQSISSIAMDQGAFKIFFEQAMNAIGEITLIDMAEVIYEVKHNIGWSQKDERTYFHAA